jgi:HAE1 family hydrophobic/amphiphilic exporter-1
MALPDLSLRRPVATSMLFVAVAVLGVVSFLRLPIDLLPDVSFPTLSVWTTYADAGPEEVERFVTEPIEAALWRVPGAREVTSRSREGQSLVRLEFGWGTDMEFATLNTRERLDNLREALPRSAERPVILRSDPQSDPIMNIAVSGADLRELRQLAEAVFKRRLEQLDGIALAAVTGGPEREILVQVDPERLAIHDVTLDEIAAALDAANYNAPGGAINRGRFRYSLRTLGQFSALEQFAEVVVARPPGGNVVQLSDVATVKDTIAELETIARYNGEAAIGLQIYKESGSNTVRVADRVRRTLDQLRVEYPRVEMELASSQAIFVRNAISNVVQALLLGGLLAFLVLFLFLREPRYPVAISLAIPISVMAAFALLYVFDVSVNIMSLGGLALGVGLLVDNSIVVLENIFRHRQSGPSRAPDPGDRAPAPGDGDAGSSVEGRMHARPASIGAREVAGAITASTLTTIAVFFPVLYVEGVAGALFGDLSLAVTFSLLASLLVALTLLPVMASRAKRRAAGIPVGAVGGGLDVSAGAAAAGRSDRQRWMNRAQARASRIASSPFKLMAYIGRSVVLTLADIGRVMGRTLDRGFRPFLDAFDRAFRRFAERYERTLEWSLAHRGAVLGIAAGALAAALLIGGALPMSLMPEVDERLFRVELELPVGTPLQTTSETAGRLESVLLEMEGVDGVFTRVGRARDSELATRELTGLNSAAIEVRLLARGTGTGAVVEELRRSIQSAGVDPVYVSVETGRSTSLGRALDVGESDLAVKVQGAELDELLPVAEAVADRMRALEELADVRVDVQLTQPVLEVRVDQDAAALHGLTVREVADGIEALLRGSVTDRSYAEFSDKIDIRVAIPGAARQDLAEVMAVRIKGVPIEELVLARPGYGPLEVRREDQNRTVQVLADVQGGGLAAAVRRVEEDLAQVPRPALVSVRVGGQNEDMRASFRSLGFAFLLALFLVFLIMAAQFESLIQPLVVLTAVPLAAIGTVAALALTGAGINVMSGIGLVILIGIVVNDAIVKIDFINQRRAVGIPKRAAILAAGRLRLRPIIMTTVTTVVGLLPLALGWGAGADLRAPLAIVVIGGLISATFLTLLVVPVIYSLLVEPRVSVATPEPAPAPATLGVPLPETSA